MCRVSVRSCTHYCKHMATAAVNHCFLRHRADCTSRVVTNAADCMYTICFTPACVHRWPFCLDYIVVSVRVDASLVAVKRGFRPRRDVGVVFRVLFSVARREEGFLGETGTRPGGGGESSTLFPHVLLMTPLLMGHEKSCKYSESLLALLTRL